jgi:hypothetical protein
MLDGTDVPDIFCTKLAAGTRLRWIGTMLRCAIVIELQKVLHAGLVGDAVDDAVA